MLSSFPQPVNACIFGANGGIGAALIAELADDPEVAKVYGGARNAEAPGDHAKVHRFAFDLLDERSIAAAAQAIDVPLHLVIIATGLLHDGEALQPERAAKMQSSDSYARAYATNATGPALIGKHFIPLLPKNGRCIFAALSARVGSISDNQTGGWHAYRASKAALNMIVRNFAIELRQKNKEAVAVTLHPGTVDTRLSQPFQRNVAAGKLFAPASAAEHLLKVLDQLAPEQNGSLLSWDGSNIPF